MCRERSSTFGAYAGIGPVIGFRDLTTSDQPGAGLIGNIGASYTPIAPLAIGLELSGVTACDANIERFGWSISPTFVVSVRF